MTGFPYTVQQKLEELVGLFAVFLSRSRAVRRLGSAALDICYVAAGRMDGFWEQGLNAWDIAAGVLLVQEAGGPVTDLDGGPFDLRSGRIIATNGRIHNELQDVIREYLPRSLPVGPNAYCPLGATVAPQSHTANSRKSQQIR